MNDNLQNKSIFHKISHSYHKMSWKQAKSSQKDSDKSDLKTCG